MKASRRRFVSTALGGGLAHLPLSSSPGLPLAKIEFAILDMLDRIAQKPVGQLIGEIHNPDVGLCVATEWRERPVEESIELIKKAVAEHPDARALKIKVGGLMFMTRDMYAAAPPGRIEKMIPLVRKTFGDDMWHRNCAARQLLLRGIDQVDERRRPSLIQRAANERTVRMQDIPFTGSCREDQGTCRSGIRGRH